MKINLNVCLPEGWVPGYIPPDYEDDDQEDEMVQDFWVPEGEIAMGMAHQWTCARCNHTVYCREAAHKCPLEVCPSCGWSDTKQLFRYLGGDRCNSVSDYRQTYVPRHRK